MLSHILNLVDSNSWSADQIDRTETKVTLEALVPAEIVDFLFDHYMVESTDKTNQNGEYSPASVVYTRLVNRKAWVQSQPMYGILSSTLFENLTSIICSKI
jgi:hypothetical protein